MKEARIWSAHYQEKFKTLSRYNDYLLNRARFPSVVTSILSAIRQATWYTNKFASE